MFRKKQRLRIVYPSETVLPHITLSQDENGTKVYSGLVSELIKTAAKRLNFTYEIIPPVDNHYGSIVNGTWNGMVGMAYRKEVDVIVAPLTITYPRSLVIEFSDPFYFESLGILIRLPKKTVSLWNMMLVFSLEVWLTLFVCLGAVVIILRCLYWLDVVRPEMTKVGILSCLWIVYGALLNQLCIIHAKTWSNRIFQLGWRISIFLLIATYSGCLVAALTTSQFLLPFKDFGGLAEAVSKGEYKFCTPFGTAFYEAIMVIFLILLLDPIQRSAIFQGRPFLPLPKQWSAAVDGASRDYKILGQWLRENKKYSPDSFTDCVDFLLKEANVAFVNEISYLETVQLDHCSDNPTVLLPDRFFTSFLAFGFQKGSQIRDPLSDFISDLVGHGIVDYLKKYYYQKGTFCKIVDTSESIVAQTDTLKLIDVGGPFILLISGLCIAIIVAVIETLVNRRF